MEDILEDPETIQDKDLFFTIWTKPSESLKYIIRRCPEKNVSSIIGCCGIASALTVNLLYLLYHTHFSILLIMIIGLLGWLFIWLWVYITSLLMSWSGKWIGGRADMDEFVTITAWSLIPTICTVFPLAV